MQSQRPADFPDLRQLWSGRRRCRPRSPSVQPPSRCASSRRQPMTPRRHYLREVRPPLVVAVGRATTRDSRSSGSASANTSSCFPSRTPLVRPLSRTRALRSHLLRSGNFLRSSSRNAAGEICDGLPQVIVCPAGRPCVLSPHKTDVASAIRGHEHPQSISIEV
jgi:hypothetical protein